MLVVAMTNSRSDSLAGRRSHGAVNAGVVAPGLQAGEVDLTGPG